MRAGDSITIRGHHLLCMLGFEGRGYSRAFTRNLERITRLLSRSGDMKIVLSASCDSICAACPHSDCQVCAKPGGAAEKVAALDGSVLARIDMPAGTTATVREVYRRVAEGICEDDIGTDLCADCEWLYLGSCVSGLARLKSSGVPFEGDGVRPHGAHGSP